MRASIMQLERREAIELVLSSGASLLSQVATRLLVSPVSAPALNLKRTNLKKVTKRNWDSGSETPWKEELWQGRAVQGAEAVYRSRPKLLLLLPAAS
jgi:hypothetical protein